MQDDKPLAFYSRKMNNAQRRYTTGEQELLSIAETLKEFRSLLLGQKLIVHTDHMNIIHGKLSNDRITRWRLLLEEYGPKYIHIAGKNNVVADALSRYDSLEEDKSKVPTVDEVGIMHAYAMSHGVRDEGLDSPDGTDMEAIASTFTSANDAQDEEFPMAPPLIAKWQKKDKQIQKLFTTKASVDYDERRVEGVTLLTYKGKIVVPKRLQGRIIAWYHLYLRHPGKTRM